MILKMFHGLIEADGEPIENALFAATVFELLKARSEMDEAEHEKETLEKFGGLDIMELMKQEMFDETGSTESNSTGNQQRKPVSKPRRDADGSDRMESASE